MKTLILIPVFLLSVSAVPIPENTNTVLQARDASTVPPHQSFTDAIKQDAHLQGIPKREAEPRLAGTTPILTDSNGNIIPSHPSKREAQPEAEMPAFVASTLDYLKNMFGKRSAEPEAQLSVPMNGLLNTFKNMAFQQVGMTPPAPVAQPAPPTRREAEPQSPAPIGLSPWAGIFAATKVVAPPAPQTKREAEAEAQNTVPLAFSGIAGALQAAQIVTTPPGGTPPGPPDPHGIASVVGAGAKLAGHKMKREAEPDIQLPDAVKSVFNVVKNMVSGGGTPPPPPPPPTKRGVSTHHVGPEMHVPIREELEATIAKEKQPHHPSQPPTKRDAEAEALYGVSKQYVPQRGPEMHMPTRDELRAEMAKSGLHQKRTSKADHTGVHSFGPDSWVFHQYVKPTLGARSPMINNGGDKTINTKSAWNNLELAKAGESSKTIVNTLPGKTHKYLQEAKRSPAIHKGVPGTILKNDWSDEDLIKAEGTSKTAYQGRPQNHQGAKRAYGSSIQGHITKQDLIKNNGETHLHEHQVNVIETKEPRSVSNMVYGRPTPEDIRKGDFHFLRSRSVTPVKGMPTPEDIKKAGDAFTEAYNKAHPGGKPPHPIGVTHKRASEDRSIHAENMKEARSAEPEAFVANYA